MRKERGRGIGCEREGEGRERETRVLRRLSDFQKSSETFVELIDDGACVFVKAFDSHLNKI